MKKCLGAIAVFLSLSAPMHGLTQASPTAHTVSGQWVLNLGPRTLMILSLRRSDKPGKVVSGTLLSEHFTTKDSRFFSHIGNDVEKKIIVASSWQGKTLSLITQDAADTSDTTTLLMTLTDPTQARLELAGASIPAFLLTRAQGVSSLAQGWDEKKIYATDDTLQSNPEMKRIFEEDQGLRKSLATFEDADVSKADTALRQATMALLAKDALHTGEDFGWAAVVIQHGGTSDDYLLAHTLGLIALSKGDADSLFIITTSLDGYLQSIQQPQIYGTRFHHKEGKRHTEEPFNSALISDLLRHQLGVPDLEAQKKQGKEYDQELGITQ